MNRSIIKIVFTLLIIIILINLETPRIKSENAVTCDVIVSTNKLRIYPGDNLTIDIHLIGQGIIETGFLTIISDFQLDLSSYKIKRQTGVEEQPLKPLKNLYRITIYPFYPQNTLMPTGYKPINDTWDSSIYEMQLHTPNDLRAGNHEITFIYIFQDNTTGKWDKVVKTSQIYVNTFYEQYSDFCFVVGSIFLPIGLAIIGFYVAFLIALYFHKEELKNIIIGNELNNIKKRKKWKRR